ncbi:TIGR04255 family protein [Pseudophaeobacter sp.]|uniref:TIGR04255 family protein n=1 Tax=Pseudophaeobacter sp. TaxID=1971739 RepID=UPI00326D6038
MAWRPLHEGHAIERVRVTCTFQADIRLKFTQRLAGFVEAKRSNFQLGPMRELKGQGVVVQVGPNGAVNAKTEEAIGWTFQRTLPDQRVVESVSFENGTLSYEVAEYTRWAPFHQRVVALLEDVVEELSTYDDMAVLALEYFDRFVYQGPANESDPRAIFTLDSKMLPAAALDAGHLWHVHRGWFEPSSRGALLVNQNLDAQDGEFNGKPARSVAVMTKVEARSTHSQLSSASLTDCLPEMHTRSKQVLQGILEDDTIGMIGMRND